ncbi:BspA family leucine-rich repeat surface protein [Acinetobacter sp. V89_7]|uniref:BspA family leucine-rich repeat surface protein n=1 Tax=Acinetobacter sp. V89_7 TaxID=3044233 RepID=UPI00249F5B22|nr:BspA family leucine-rich repeat surface protein [Acinetobacter sp. V89_7]MDI3379301.1 BspA family leucine-rich repeat surface protein [Acinetobacter sp. V89_7]
MSCTVFKSTNTVDQSINVFPPKGYISNVRIVRNYDVENGDIFKFRNDFAKEFKVVGGTLTCTSLGITNPTTEGVFNSASEIVLKIDEGRDYAYLSWKDKDRILGFDPPDASNFFGAYPDYSLGIHADGVTSINGICIRMGSYNQRVNSWDVSEVTDAAYAFAGAGNFDRRVDWDAPKLLDINHFLMNAAKFNKDINIRGAKLKNVSFMLEGAVSFNSELNIDTSECDNFSGMFFGAAKFNKQLIGIDFSKALFINNIFGYAKSFNQPVDFGNTPNLVEAYYLFSDNNFNAPVKFNAPSLRDVSGWFSNNPKFNNTITGSFRSVVSMAYFFWNASSFNKPINDWDIRNVMSFTGFLQGATSFNQDLSPWAAKFNVNSNMADVSSAPNWSTENYDKYLNALWLDVGTTRQNEWANGTSPKTVYAQVKRSTTSQAAVSGLIGAGWTIVDGGLV